MRQYRNVLLEIEDTPLENRRCPRCKGEDFRALVFEPYSYKCGCSVECQVSMRSNSGNEGCQSSIPLVLCLKCLRLVSL